MCTCKPIKTTAVAVSGTNLVLTIPSMTFNNCEKYIICVAQAIPDTATNLMSVAIQIGDGTTLYPMVRRCGHYVYANQIKANQTYCLLVAADTQRFVVVGGNIICTNCGTATTLPAAGA